MTLHVPPLRERPGEIAPLSEHFLRQLGHTGKVRVQRIHPRALEALCSYRWPGNVRQLRHVIERACAIAEGPEIGLDDLPDNVLDGLRGRAPSTDTPGAATLDEQLARYERQLLEAALAAAGGNQSQAARVLGVPRRTLSYRMQVLGLRGGRSSP
jgi:DNA-binding NtrC family response regulator